jgi:hypothetical protein
MSEYSCFEQYTSQDLKVLMESRAPHFSPCIETDVRCSWLVIALEQRDIRTYDMHLAGKRMAAGGAVCKTQSWHPRSLMQAWAQTVRMKLLKGKS